jgi:surface carbohydrate biosynthesis protein (TIGR04326 family)
LNKTIIWDLKRPLPCLGPKSTALLWSEFVSGDHANIISIPDLVEKNSQELRARYLAWIYDLGEVVIRGKRLIDYFDIYQGCNYWWTTLFNEKCNFSKSPNITDAIKFMALVDWLSKNSVKCVFLESHNIRLAKCLRRWCDSNGIGYAENIEPSLSSKGRGLNAIFSRLPYIVRAILWVINYLYFYWPSRGLGVDDWISTPGRITFISYLLKPDPTNAQKIQDDDRYWGSLPEHLKQEDCQINWLHMYVRESLKSNAREVVNALNMRSHSAQKLQTHVILESFLSAGIIFGAVKVWCKTIWLGFKLKDSVICFSKQMQDVDLWQFFTDDWNESMFGPVAISNAFNIVLFSKAFQLLPKQRVGIFLQENQGWEFACAQSWRVENHGELIGCPHSSIRFWDLRYFFDPRTYFKDKKNTLPRPDIVALNSESALNSYINAGYPVAELVKVEALRYLYLDRLAATLPMTCEKLKGDFHLLVLGDYLERNSRYQLEMLEGSIRHLPFKVNISFRPHPACSIDLTDYPSLNISLARIPLADALAISNAAYVSPITSAAIDAYCAGIPVISTLDPDMLNLSPLRSDSGVIFVRSAEQLAQAITFCINSLPLEREVRNYFIVDSKLPRWRKLLFR